METEATTIERGAHAEMEMAVWEVWEAQAERLRGASSKSF
jgi:hypothetical protein